MKYKDFTLGQIEAVFNKLGGEEGVKNFLSKKTVVRPVDGTARVLENLDHAGNFTIPKIEPFVVGKKFQHRAKKKTGIQTYLWDNFQDWIINPLKEEIVQLDEETVLEKFMITQAMHDTEIQKELLHPEPIHVRKFLPMLRHMLSKQSNGEDGTLLTNGYANIFHVKLDDKRVVSVYAYWHGGEWYCSAYELDCERRWNDGYAFFSPAAA